MRMKVRSTQPRTKPSAVANPRRRRTVAAVAAAREVEALVAAAGGELRVFGSLAVEGGRHFGPHSDVDVLVCGLPPGTDSTVAAEVFARLAERGFDADVVPERFAPAALRERVARDGRRPRDLG